MIRAHEDNRVETVENATISLIVLIGGAWGLVEATVGFALHLLRRVVELPGLTGYIMFPIGLFFMLAAVRRTGKPAAALAVAAVAAAVKLASGFLPSVPWIFVVNPALAILAEGAVVFVGARLFRFNRSEAVVVPAVIVSVAWRVAFLALVVLLPVQKGILMKGAPAILSFLLLESAVNGLLIAAACRIGADPARLGAAANRLARPSVAAATLILALGVQVVTTL